MDSNPSKQVANNLAAICNIPKSFHSADLRNYFSQIIEQEVFSCFHFKHRPEIKRGGVYGKQISDTCVCVVSLCEPAAFEKLKAYEGNNWIDKSGEYLQTKCKVVKLFTCMNESLEQQKYLTKQDKNYKSRHAPLEEFSKNDLQNLSELNPPRHVMPNGNVGTPIPVFLKLIQNCKLPTSVIKKLGLVFPTTASHRKYGNVPYAYDEESEPISSAENMFTMTTGNEVNILPNAEMMYKSDYQADNPDVSESNDIPGKQESDSDDDDDTCEEWERHEAFHNDVTSQERDKERLFEDEIELKWEKGGSGLVFYTDAQYWAEEDGDFDEQNTDQWDVDTSEFYGNDGDRDAKDFVQICKEKRLHSGNSLLSKRTCKTKDQFGGTMGSSNTNTVGQFETYTKGIGRKILKKFGWKDNEGLGASGKSGITEPIVAEGQEPNQKNGLGFYGENILNNAIKSTGKKYVTNVQVKQMQKLDSSVTHKAVEPLASHSYLFPQFRSNLVSVSSKHKPLSKQKRQKAVPGNDGIIITTKYDAPLDIDEDSGYLRSQHPYSLKHSSAKSHAADSFEPDKKHDVLASTSKLVYHKTRTSVNDETSLPCNANKRTAGFTPHMHFVRPVSETEWTLFPS